MKMLIIKTASVYICLRILRGPLKRVGYYRPRSRKMNTLPGQGATLTHMEASVSDRKREQSVRVGVQQSDMQDNPECRDERGSKNNFDKYDDVVYTQADY